MKIIDITSTHPFLKGFTVHVHNVMSSTSKYVIAGLGKLIQNNDNSWLAYIIEFVLYTIFMFMYYITYYLTVAVILAIGVVFSVCLHTIVLCSLYEWKF